MEAPSLGEPDPPTRSYTTDKETAGPGSDEGSDEEDDEDDEGHDENISVPAQDKRVGHLDATVEFRGNPRAATAHFLRHQGDLRNVRVFSLHSKTWWRNCTANRRLASEPGAQQASPHVYEAMKAAIALSQGTQK